MRVLAHRGNRLHAPENTRIALISAYTAGADALEMDVQLTRDGQLVVSHDPTTERLTGDPRPIIEMDFDELRELSVSRTFEPRGAAAGYRYRPGAKPDVIERFPALLDLLPRDVPKLVELKHDSSLATGRRDEFVRAATDAIAARRMTGEVILYSKDPENLTLARQLLPGVRVASFDWERDAAAQVQLMVDLEADGAVVDVTTVLGPDGALTDAGRELERLHAGGGPALGAIVYLHRDLAVPTEDELRALSGHDFVWSVSTDSMLDVAAFARSPQVVLEESFAGKEVDTDRFALGYAKANRYCHVFQDDGVHVKIAEYDGELPPARDKAEQRLRRIEERLWYALKDWPFYSGGGLGVMRGLEGDFAAEVDYTMTRAGQASTLEMALVNVDPSKHQEPWNPDGSPRLPGGRDKSIFFDPHGAPPFVGSEHDEDDGYRVTHNLGSDYDDNQWGRPVGNGKALAARLRLERRGAFFSAYYRNDEAPDWVCSGATRNDTMNPRVFLRCVAKRWRQERTDDPSAYYPIVPVEFVFRDLGITRWWPRS
jgi:glycerophosphoryl diester phosphodiesterase